jgi:hypothetical protein
MENPMSDHGGEDLAVRDVPEQCEKDAVEISLRVKAGPEEERIIEMQAGQTLAAVLVIIASERAVAVEELIIVREGEIEPLSPLIVIDGEYPHHHRHHVHHVSEVIVTVYYGAKDEHRDFKRQATVEDVLVWAWSAAGQPGCGLRRKPSRPSMSSSWTRRRKCPSPMSWRSRKRRRLSS